MTAPTLLRQVALPLVVVLAAAVEAGLAALVEVGSTTLGTENQD